jgi:aminopeptidase-like protein
MSFLTEGESLIGLIDELCAFRSGVAAPDNEALFARLGRELPFFLHRYASGQEHNGWLVPPRWSVRKALLRKNGRVVFDGTCHSLGVASLSRSFHGDLSWEALAPHLVTNPRLPDAFMFHCMWQYRPWAADWALCVPYRQFREFGPGDYGLELETVSEPGEMVVAEYVHQGESPRTIVFQAHTCHPGQANDGFAAVALLLRLFQWLQGRSTRHTYRLLLGPEHLGTVFWLRDRTEQEVADMVGGVFMEMPGVAAPLKAAASFLGGQAVDRAVANALCGTDHVHVPWRQGAGNDETVWESPGYEVPFVELTRCIDQFDPYPEYHSSLDTAASCDLDRMEEMFAVLCRVVEIHEGNAVAHRLFDGLVCLSNPRYGLYQERPDPTVDKDCDDQTERWGRLLDSLPRYFDGATTVLDMAARHGLPFLPLLDYLRRFEAKGLIRLAPVLAGRPPISKRSAPW